MTMTAVLLLFIAGVGGVGYYFNEKANEQMTEMYKDRLLPVEWLNDSRAHVRAIDANLFELMMTANPSRRAELEADNARRAGILNANLEKYGKIKLDPFEQDKLAELKTNLQAARASRSNMLEHLKAGRNTEAYLSWYSQVKLPSEAFQKNLRELSEYNQQVADQINTQNDVDYARTVKILLGIILAALVIGGLLSRYIARTITVPLESAIQFAGRGCGYFLGLFYATNPKFRRYSKGLIAPSDILIRFSLYQCRYSSRIAMNSSMLTPAQERW